MWRFLTLKQLILVSTTIAGKGNSLKLFDCNNTNFENGFLDASVSKLSGYFCMAYDDRFDSDSRTSYVISVDLFNTQTNSGHNKGHVGLAFNLLDTRNYEGLYIR